MRHLAMLGLVLTVGLEMASTVAAQTGTARNGAPSAVTMPPAGRPTIQTVTMSAGDGLLIISGTGFGADAAVTIEGQPVTVLPGASATQLTVEAPASVLTTAGTYRLTVTVPGQPADVFVVASQPGMGAPGPAGTAGPAGASSPGARTPCGRANST